MGAPVFFSIASTLYPGYNVVQRGAQIVLAAENLDNPFQLWYKDDSWRFYEDTKGNPAFALINNGSKAALMANASVPPKLSLNKTYDASEDADKTSLWTSRTSSDETGSAIYSMASAKALNLGLGKSPPELGDGVTVILGTQTTQSKTIELWQLNEYVPTAYTIQSYWYTQILFVKNAHEDVTFTASTPSGTFNDELTVVAVSSGNANGDQDVWYKVPARGRPEDSNSSFIVISKSNGKALKGSTKPGDKVVVTEFDPLDDNFVWSENRSLTSQTSYVAINLANGDSTLHWHLPQNSEYQNKSYYHPLTVRVATDGLNRQLWSFTEYTA